MMQTIVVLINTTYAILGEFHSLSHTPCSDGMGRTGTFICIHAQLERLKTEGVVDFFQYIKSARIHRAELVPEVVRQRT